MADKNYTVTWSYDCCVSSPEEAARLASEVMLTYGGKLGGSLHGGHRSFVVYDQDGGSCDVELPDRQVDPGPEKHAREILWQKIHAFARAHAFARDRTAHTKRAINEAIDTLLAAAKETP